MPVSVRDAIYTTCLPPPPLLPVDNIAYVFFSSLAVVESTQRVLRDCRQLVVGDSFHSPATRCYAGNVPRYFRSRPLFESRTAAFTPSESSVRTVALIELSFYSDKRGSARNQQTKCLNCYALISYLFRAPKFGAINARGENL